MTDDADAFSIIARRVAPGGRLARRWSLKGGVSARVEALEIVMPDASTRRVVVRQHGAAHWKSLEDDVTRTEHALLVALHRAGMAVPAPLMIDSSREVLPSPYLVQEYVEGTTELAPAALACALPQMASFLARLHTLHPDALELSLPTREEPTASTLQYLPANDEGDRIRAALAAHGPLAPVSRPSLLHGDFWPGNVLFHEGRLAAVIDWEDAAWGDALCDLAGARVELLWRHGEEAVETFTAHYLSAAPQDCTRLPYWELYVASAGLAYMGEWGLDPAVEAAMRARSVAFLERARRAVAASC